MVNREWIESEQNVKKYLNYASRDHEQEKNFLL